MNFTYSLAHLMGGIILLCGFSQVSQRRLAAMITLGIVWQLCRARTPTAGSCQGR